MQKKIELKPMAEVGRGYAAVSENGVEIRISGVMGALKAWLIGRENRAIGNLVNGRLVREIDTAPYWGVLVTQSGKQMFYAQWRSEPESVPAAEGESAPEHCGEAAEEAESAASPLPEFGWQKITARDYPSADEGVRLALSNRAFFEAFKKYGYYLFGRDGDRCALAVRHAQNDPAPFPNNPEASEAGDYVYLVI